MTDSNLQRVRRPGRYPPATGVFLWAEYFKRRPETDCN